jgi:hypothetical protein
MNIEKIKLGTKIKMLNDNESGYWKKGGTGIIVNDSCFHDKGKIRDRDGQFWAKIEGSRAERCCLDLHDFKILKY